MKKAKENRTYRKRTDSEEGAKQHGEKDEAYSSKSQSKHRKRKDDLEEGEEKEEGEEGSEKEEGEIDSNEEEDADKHHKKSSSRKKRSRRSKSFSSISSRSGSDRSTSRKKRSRRRDARIAVDKNLILATLNEKIQAATKGATGKPSVEAVDSEEDFDNLGNNQHIQAKAAEGLRPDRSNISFSFNKKPATNIMSGSDFEFGMSQKTQMAPQPAERNTSGGDQIVISSDSEADKGMSKKNGKKKSNAPNDGEEEGSHNVSDQSDLKLCEETVMKDIFADMAEEEEANKTNTNVEVPIKSEPVEEPMDTQENVCSSRNIKQEIANSPAETEIPIPNDFGGANASEATSSSYANDIQDPKNINDADSGEEEIGLVDLAEDDQTFPVEDEEDSNSRTKYQYEDIIDPAADSEATGDQTEFYHNVDNLSLEENSTNPADVAGEEEGEEGEIEDALVELDPREARALASAAPVQMQGRTEIIGEIEPSNQDAATTAGLPEESSSSWSSRWLQSEKVQKVVTSSKMLSRMRKRIKKDKINAKSATSSTGMDSPSDMTSKIEERGEEDKTLQPDTVPVINSMEEYQKLMGQPPPQVLPVHTPEVREQQQEQQPQQPVAAAHEVPAAETVEVVASSDDDSDEDLWSKMMGN